MTTTNLTEIDLSLVGTGNWVTHSLTGGAYETDLIMGTEGEAFLICSYTWRGREIVRVQFANVLGVGETDGDAASMKDETFAAARRAAKAAL
jgi:hypothetical protein